MKFEVEQKYPVVDFKSIERALVELDACFNHPQGEVDLYFAHPVRDFATTDEALRIRSKDGKALITYKGPKIDKTTKTRREIELMLGTEPNSSQQWQSLLEALGFSAVAEVRKTRRKANVQWHDANIAVTFDEVEQVGTFVELEIESDQAEVEAAKALIASLADHMGLDRSERRSYLELLLSQQ